MLQLDVWRDVLGSDTEASAIDQNRYFCFLIRNFESSLLCEAFAYYEFLSNIPPIHQ